jgi:hypothetical protein
MWLIFVQSRGYSTFRDDMCVNADACKHVAVVAYIWELTPWRQDQKIYHRNHKSPPPVPILSQLNPLHTLPANLPKIRSDPILPSTQ